MFYFDSPRAQLNEKFDDCNYPGANFVVFVRLVQQIIVKFGATEKMCTNTVINLATVTSRTLKFFVAETLLSILNNHIYIVCYYLYFYILF